MLRAMMLIRYYFDCCLCQNTIRSPPRDAAYYACACFVMPPFTLRDAHFFRCASAVSMLLFVRRLLRHVLFADITLMLVVVYDAIAILRRRHAFRDMLC